MSRLRPALIGGSAAVLILFACAGLAGFWAAGFLTIVGYCALLLVALLIERSRYKRILTEPPGASWRATTERFIDPETGRAVVVWEEPATGRRAYVAADA